MNLDRDQLQRALHSVAMPALAGAAGGGALGAYMSRDHLEGESPSQRRHRVLRNALVSAGLGGVAGAALPAGLKMLSEPYFGSGITGGPSVMDKLIGAGSRNILPLAGMGAAGFGLHKWNDAARQRALQHVFENVKGPWPRTFGESKPIESLGNVRHLMESGDDATRGLLLKLTEGGPKGENFMHNLFRAAETLQQAGHAPITGAKLKQLFGNVDLTPHLDPRYAEHTEIPRLAGENMSEHYADYLSKMPFSGGIAGNTESLAARGAGRLSQEMPGVAEAYSRLMRPGASRMFGRMFGPVAGLGLLGAGALGGSYLQNSLTGN